MPALFVHRFATASHKYVFDVNTSRVLRLPPAVWDIVEDVGVLADADLLARHGATYSSAEISGACDAIRSAQQEGLLSPNRPNEIVMPYDLEYIQTNLASGRTSLTLVVTEQCNFRCSYCVYGGTYAHRRTHSVARMSWDTARRAIDDFLAHSADAKGRGLRFYGGEPLLDLPLVRQSIEHVHLERGQTDVQFTLTTNGSMLEGEAADLLARYQTRLNVSLDGPEQVHDRYRRLADGSPSWRRVMGNVRLFLEKHPEYRENGRLRFHSVIAPPADFRILEEFYASCDLFTPQMSFSLGHVSDVDTTVSECIPLDGRFLEGFDAVHARFIENLKNGTFDSQHDQPAFWVQKAMFERVAMAFYKRGYATSECPSLPERFCPLPMCLPGIRRLYVNTDGAYYPCERVQETPTFRIGSVDEGVSATKVRNLLQTFVDLSKEQCRSCWCVSMCTAGCVVAVMKEGKLDPDAREQACVSCRNRTHRIMIDVCEAMEANPRALQYMDAITLS